MGKVKQSAVSFACAFCGSQEIKQGIDYLSSLKLMTLLLVQYSIFKETKKVVVNFQYPCFNNPLPD